MAIYDLEIEFQVENSLESIFFERFFIYIQKTFENKLN